MNNKGFAITGILYGLMILFVIVITSFLAVVVGKSKRDNEVLNNVKESLSLNSSETVYWSKFNYANYGWTYNGYRYSYVTDRRALYTFENADYDTCVSMYLPKGTVVIIDSEGRLSYSLYGSENEAEFKEMSDSCYGELYNKPNSPDLVDGLIPVVYNETTSKWVKADSTNENNSWYDYTQKKWANAVLVTSVNRSIYQNAKPGEEILDNDILAFYVWIPRYKYKVWNINKVIRKDSYSAQISGIDVIFESGTSSTGTISCTYSFAAPSSTAGSPNETCAGSNEDYYTHPAFTFGDSEVKGFWIGKYELSSETPTATNGGGSSTTLTARILPNVNSWRNNSLSNFNTVIQSMQTTNNIYGLGADKSNTDSHMLTNMEWGAVAYLTHSAFGRCYGTNCTEVTINNCSTYVTGIGADTVSASSSSTTCTTDANKYNGAKGVLASSTGNVYGVYDMSGGAWEYVMGNTSSTADSYTFSPSTSGFASSWYSNYSNQKYVNTYANDSASSNQTAYNRARLGDATGEVVSSSGYAWYNDSAYFPYSSVSWFVRGGVYGSGSGAGVFFFSYYFGSANSGYSARATLVSLK